MLFVQMNSKSINPGKVHLAANRMKTLCGKTIPTAATELEKPPRDKKTVCKRCQVVDAEERRYHNLFR